MSHYLVELYTPNSAWLALSAEQRQHFLGGIGLALNQLSSLGVEVLSLAATDSNIDQGTMHTFLGIWRFPDQTARDALLAGIKASGWYDYFDHVNAACTQGAADIHLAALAAA